jgi:hypothetical protein
MTALGAGARWFFVPIGRGLRAAARLSGAALRRAGAYAVWIGSAAVRTVRVVLSPVRRAAGAAGAVVGATFGYVGSRAHRAGRAAVAPVRRLGRAVAGRARSARAALRETRASIRASMRGVRQGVRRGLGGRTRPKA